MKNSLQVALSFLFLACSFPALHAQESTGYYGMDKIQEVRISFVQDNWAYLLDSLRFNGDGLLLGNLEINGQRFQNVGVRYKASKSFTPGKMRNSLHIELDYINQEQKLEGHRTVELSNALRDPSMIREVLAYEIARDYMPAPQANFAQVSINGSPYGLMVNVEPVGDAFLDRNFGSSNGALFKAKSFDPYANYPENCKQNLYGSLDYDNGVDCYLRNFEMLGESGWDDLIELTQILKEDPGKIESVLHVDRTLWMLAFNNVIVNLSSYSGQHSQNYFLYRDNSGRFNPVIWDLNLSFGSYKNIGTGSDLRFKQLIELDPLLHIDNPSKPLLKQLLENEQYQKTYLSHMRQIVFDHFEDGQYEKRARELQQLIQVAFANDPNKQYSFEEFNQSLDETIGKKSRIPGIVELMSKRAEFLAKHPLLSVLPPEILETQVIGRPQFSSRRVETFRVTTRVEKYPKRVKLMYRFHEDEPFQEAMMYDDGNNNDQEANDSVYGVTIVPQDGEESLEYYIVAENASIISFDPPNYMWERYVTKLEELNQ